MQIDPLPTNRSTEGMVDYNDNSSVQQARIAAHEPTIRRLARRIKSVGSEFAIADYGCGPGFSTIHVARVAIESYRELRRDGTIAVYHVDQAGNDWEALKELLAGSQSYTHGRAGIRSEACIGSFYDRVVDDDSIDLATCFAASHWLSQAIHIDAPGSIWFADLSGEARQQMAAVERADWLRFLRLRAQELRPGGHLLVSALGAVPDIHEANGIAASGRGCYRAIQTVAQSMVEDGLLNKAVLDRFVFGVWFRTEQEARKPIETDPILSRSFDIEEVSVQPALKNADDVFGELIGDPAGYARRYTSYMRAFAESTLYEQLFRKSASSYAEAGALRDEFYRRFEDLYVKHPGKYKFEVWTMTVVLRKRT